MYIKNLPRIFCSSSGPGWMISLSSWGPWWLIRFDVLWVGAHFHFECSCWFSTSDIVILYWGLQFFWLISGILYHLEGTFLVLAFNTLWEMCAWNLFFLIEFGSQDDYMYTVGHGACSGLCFLLVLPWNTWEFLHSSLKWRSDISLPVPQLGFHLSMYDRPWI